VGNKAVSHLARIQQCAAVVIADDDRVERVVGNVAADEELPAFVDPVFEPGAASLAGFVE